jgi:mRNA interferase MazF
MSFGVNVGSEIDGKGESFTRPGLMLHVIGSHLAFVAPLSTKVKEVAGYLPFNWKGTTTALCIHQIRIISQKRILSRKGRISEDKLKAIKQEIIKFYNF